MRNDCTSSVEEWLERRAPDVAPRGRLKPGDTVGEWRVEAFLGSGLSAEVYRVRNSRFGHEGALKLLKDGSRGLAARFQTESDAIRFLGLSALPRFLGAGVADGTPYYVMEHLLPLPDPMPCADVPRFMARTAKAVHSLHEAGYVHRDLKPGNVLMRRNGEPVLIDLGLLKRRGSGRDRIVCLAHGVSVVDGKPVGVGTLDYAAPEQLLKGESSVQSDVFALGKMLRALYCGRPPRSMRQIVRRATRETPGDRYASAAGFAAAIRHRNRPAVCAAALAAFAAAAASFAWTHRQQISKAALDFLSPPETVIVHKQGPGEADAAYFGRMKALAEKGDVLAQIAAAEALFHGRGTATNREEAVAWYRRAALAGEADAQASLGLCLFRGWGCERNQAEAAAWYAKAAAQGNLGAMNDLAFCRLHGFGVEKDPEKGFALAMEAAARGHAASQTLVGECYLDGLGVEADVGRAETWLYRAARQNNARALALLRNR